MSHYSDEDVTAYLIDPSLLDEPGEIESHLKDCPECAAKVAEAEQRESDFQDAFVWQTVDGFLARPPRIAEALKLQAEIDRENREAARLLTPLLQSPLRFAEGRVADRVRFHTAGVVRMLCTEANAMHEKRPAFSLQLADAACAIAARLAAPASRALALRERANALRYLGRFTEALKALDEAEPLFNGSPASDVFDRAIVGYIRGSVLVQIERASEALSIARSIVEVFRDYGDQRRELGSLLLEGACLHTLNLVNDARLVFQRVVALARQLGDTPKLAYALQAAAVTAVDLGSLEDAEKYYAQALVLYDELEIATEKIRIEWALAAIEIAKGNLDQAERLLDSSRFALQQLGLRNDHAQATLEWVEVRLALNRPAGVPQACREILVQFGSEGMNRNARMALAHLHQALAKQNATPGLVREIRLYLKELPQRPSVAFAPTR